MTLRDITIDNYKRSHSSGSNIDFYFIRGHFLGWRAGPGGVGAIIVTSADTPERPQPSCSDFAKHSSTNYVASMSLGIVISFLGNFEGANRRRPDTYKIFIGSAGYWLTN
uniref:Uncharacterized protein n=1 Tax=Hyaloperonospora arabidopsidis (strain Emoy2) TaxID=559515 RepID=M4C5B2_HYAAE